MKKVFYQKIIVVLISKKKICWIFNRDGMECNRIIFFIKEYMYFKYEFKINKKVEMLFLFEDVYCVVYFVFFWIYS